MTTARARAYSRTSVKKAIEQYLEDGEALMSQHVRKPAGTGYQTFQTQQHGAYNFARKLGFECMCTPHSKKYRTICECKAKKGGIKQGHQILSGLGRGPYVLDGAGCRDGQGNFVPISQCKGPVGRDKAGRFVSIKGAA